MSEKQDASDMLLEKAAGAIGDVSVAVKKIAPHAWELMVRQQVTEGVVYGIGCLLMTIAGLVVVAKLTRRAAKFNDIMDDPMGPMPAIAMLVVALGAFIFACQVPGYIMQAANPEYYAIQVLVKR